MITKNPPALKNRQNSIKPWQVESVLSWLCAPRLLLVFTLVFVGGAVALGAPGWPQWGGVSRNFHVATAELADSWSSTPPRKVWRRALGDGYSGIASYASALFTMYRKEDHERIVCLDATSGDTVWEHSYTAPHLPKTNLDPGPGPHANPLVVADKVFATGVTGNLHALDRVSGRVVWKHNLIEEYGGTVLYRGYSASPIAYEDRVIVPVGGQGNGVMAFLQKDGSVAWKSGDFDVSHSSPVLARVQDREQLVVYASEVIVGLDPADGRILWTAKHSSAGGYIASMPVVGADGRLFFSGAYEGGSLCFQLQPGDQPNAKELWFTKRMRVHHSNVIRIGNFVYGASGDFGPVIFTALDLAVGKVVWQDRALARASCIYADGKLIAMEDGGRLVLAKVSPKGLNILSSVELFDGRAWTPPTLIGKTLYIRNRTDIMAYALP